MANIGVFIYSKYTSITYESYAHLTHECLYGTLILSTYKSMFIELYQRDEGDAPSAGCSLYTPLRYAHLAPSSGTEVDCIN